MKQNSPGPFPISAAGLLLGLGQDAYLLLRLVALWETEIHAHALQGLLENYCALGLSLLLLKFILYSLLQAWQLLQRSVDFVACLANCEFPYLRKTIKVDSAIVQ